ncbi:MAG: hypothetical protein RLZZ127_1620 [Planctomycetota bacterium]|jgi:hypothetical protein
MTSLDTDPAFDAPVAIHARSRLRCLLDGCPAAGGNPGDCRLHQHRRWPADERDLWLEALPPWAVGSLLRHHHDCPRRRAADPASEAP